ncbi:hypothetical protein GR130_20540 [Streptomyces sp. GS7]|nr:hypothetical protein GR130_20540 [Streptomyces sp. GS7]
MIHERDQEVDWRVLAGPEGNTFCVCTPQHAAR